MLRIRSQVRQEFAVRPLALIVLQVYIDFQQREADRAVRVALYGYQENTVYLVCLDWLVGHGPVSGIWSTSSI